MRQPLHDCLSQTERGGQALIVRNREGGAAGDAAAATFAGPPAYMQLEAMAMELTLGLGYDARIYKGVPSLAALPAWEYDHPVLSSIVLLILLVLFLME